MIYGSVSARRRHLTVPNDSLPFRPAAHRRRARDFGLDFESLTARLYRCRAQDVLRRITKGCFGWRQRSARRRTVGRWRSLNQMARAWRCCSSVSAANPHCSQLPISGRLDARDFRFRDEEPAGAASRGCRSSTSHAPLRRGRISGDSSAPSRHTRSTAPPNIYSLVLPSKARAGLVLSLVF